MMVDRLFEHTWSLPFIFLFLVTFYSGVFVYADAYKRYSPVVHEKIINDTIYANVTDRYGRDEKPNFRYLDSYNIKPADIRPTLVNGVPWNGTYAVKIPAMPNDIVHYNLSFSDEYNYTYEHPGTYRNYSISLQSDKEPPHIDENEVNMKNPFKVDKDIPLLIPGQNASVAAYNITDQLAGVKNASIIYNITDNIANNHTIPMQAEMPVGGSSNNFFGTIPSNELNPGSFYYYYISSCDFIGNCQTSNKYEFKIMSSVPRFNRLNITTTFSGIDLSNMTVHMRIIITTELHLPGEIQPNLEGISVDPRSNSTGELFPVPVSYNKVVDFGENTSYTNSTRSTVHLFGDPSLFPYDSYASTVVIAIPNSSPNSFNITGNRPDFDNSVLAAWIPHPSKPIIIPASDKRLQNVKNYCSTDSTAAESSTVLCPALQELLPSSSFVIIPVNFTRNYTSSYDVISPLIGIFYLLGAIFVLDSGKEQLSNRLVLALAVFALIFTLPQIVSGMKVVSSSPTIADNLIEGIILSTIAFTASSVVASAISHKAVLWDLVVFLIVSVVVISLMLQKYPLDAWIIPVILVGLGYGLFIRIAYNLHRSSRTTPSTI
jgi:hypothetical protein